MLAKQIHTDIGTVWWDFTLATEFVGVHGPEYIHRVWRGGLVLVLLVDVFGRGRSPESFCMAFVAFLSGTKATPRPAILVAFAST